MGLGTTERKVRDAEADDEADIGVPEDSRDRRLGVGAPGEDVLDLGDNGHARLFEAEEDPGDGEETDPSPRAPNAMATGLSLRRTSVFSS